MKASHNNEEVPFDDFIKIGKQVWAAANLNVITFRNEDIIPEVKTNVDWKKASEDGKPAWCYYNGDPANGSIYGKLYNWYAVNDSRGLAPQGWHIPSDDEWGTLINSLGGYYNAGYKMKSSSGWEDNGNGNNSSQFSALPSGHRLYDGPFVNLGGYSYFWSSSDGDNYGTWFHALSFYYSGISRGSIIKGCGFSCRCVKD